MGEVDNDLLGIYAGVAKSNEYKTVPSGWCSALNDLKPGEEIEDIEKCMSIFNNKGIIVRPNGYAEEYNFDDSENHGASAYSQLIYKYNKEMYKNDLFGFIAIFEFTKKGCIFIEHANDYLILFLPDSLSLEQKETMKNYVKAVEVLSSIGDVKKIHSCRLTNVRVIINEKNEKEFAFTLNEYIDLLDEIGGSSHRKTLE